MLTIKQKHDNLRMRKKVVTHKSNNKEVMPCELYTFKEKNS